MQSHNSVAHIDEITFLKEEVGKRSRTPRKGHNHLLYGGLREPPIHISPDTEYFTGKGRNHGNGQMQCCTDHWAINSTHGPKSIFYIDPPRQAPTPVGSRRIKAKELIQRNGTNEHLDHASKCRPSIIFHGKGGSLQDPTPLTAASKLDRGAQWKWDDAKPMVVASTMGN